jgi:hypothetical protein
MFRDIELSREEMAGYKNISEERNEKLAVDLNVSILSASSWPTYPTVTVIIPPQIKQAIDKFEAHYKAKHSGRKLEFKHALAHCQLKAKFPKGSKELVVSSFQAIVLLLFNGLKQDEHMEYNYLKEATGLRKPLPRSLYISTKLTHPSPRRTKPHPPIPRLRQNPPPNQTPQIARNLAHRHLLTELFLLRPQIPHQNQHCSTQRDTCRKQRNARARRRGPQLRNTGCDCAHFEGEEED